MPVLPIRNLLRNPGIVQPISRLHCRLLLPHWKCLEDGSELYEGLLLPNRFLCAYFVYPWQLLLDKFTGISDRQVQRRLLLCVRRNLWYTYG